MQILIYKSAIYHVKELHQWGRKFSLNSKKYVCTYLLKSTLLLSLFIKSENALFLHSNKLEKNIYAVMDTQSYRILPFYDQE